MAAACHDHAQSLLVLQLTIRRYWSGQTDRWNDRGNEPPTITRWSVEPRNRGTLRGCSAWRNADNASSDRPAHAPLWSGRRVNFSTGAPVPTSSSGRTANTPSAKIRSQKRARERYRIREDSTEASPPR
jgi:hypothetical protein